ncbi:MAG: hypothetical protein ACLFUL_07520 [Desulfobacteraceae bacterium]
MKRWMWSLLAVVLAVGFLSGCSELRSEMDPKKWRYAPYDTTPPSWENDMGRPGQEFGEHTW